jgi:valyl-tRNA synthetase
MMPPPNVTGSLHMGHALTFTLQDLLIRYHRMAGRDVLWQPGTDHAGIATQMVVERQLAEKNINRRDLGRDGFVEKIWEWKAESGGMIHKQLRRLGASADWQRERFTMDDGLTAAVIKTFVQMHREGLIYRDKRLVNWDPKLMTAISDLEVEQIEQKSSMWHIRYRIEGTENEYISIATTRPETMLGDGAVAVNPEDERYQHLIGKMAILPLSNRPIPIIADEYAKMDKGSGAVKITPAHDFNDFEVGRRHDLPLINLMTATASMESIPEIPTKYQGLDRYDARRLILADLDAEGMLVQEEILDNVVPHGDRSGVVIEPWLMDQWYVNAEKLAQPAIKAVEDGRTKFVPERWNKTYFEWMRNIQPWCISRQLWWGHRIPAWYGPDGQVFVEANEDDAVASATKHYGEAVELTRDNDVLDTWFSSGLWPFSTLGWPNNTAELKRYYPGDVLVTGFDIIFFWVARMMMMGMHFMDGEVPFREVYIHALVRDEKGQKMSKSKGNVLDPLELIDQYGADSLRFTLAAMAAQGRDIKMSTTRLEGYRNFTTKIWNAARFCEINGCVIDPDFDPAACKVTLNRWIVAKTAATRDDVTRALDSYRFNEAANALYQFAWGTFCDWQLEFAKPILSGDDREAAAETRATIAWTLNRLMRLLHPIMPFLTEEITEKCNLNGTDWLISSAWPAEEPELAAPGPIAEIDWAIRFVSAVRTVRAECNIPPGARLHAHLSGASDNTLARLNRNDEPVRRLARLETITTDGAAPAKGAVQAIVDEATIVLPIGDVIDLDAEQARLAKEIDKVEKEISGIDNRLGNEKFTARAPAEVVQENRDRRIAFVLQQEKLQDALARLKAL